MRKPQEESFEDWLAVHVVDFLNRLTLLYGTVCEVCTDESCPVMSGGSRFEYLWQDGVEFKVGRSFSCLSRATDQTEAVIIEEEKLNHRLTCQQM